MKATCWRCGQLTVKCWKHIEYGWTCELCYKIELIQAYVKEKDKYEVYS